MTFNFDIVGKVVLELRTDAGVAAIAGANPTSNPARVRGGEPGPGDVHAGNDTDPYRAFVVVVSEGRQRFRVPVQRPRTVARCYGRTFAEAAALANAVSDARHQRRARSHANGLGIYLSREDAGGEADTDPDTSQPYVPIVFDDWATTVEVPEAAS